MDGVRVGSWEHRRIYCRVFVETHRPFRAADIAWPELDEESLARLRGLPVWKEAARTEAATAVKVQSLGKAEKDPVLAEAIALQGYEEQRHADIIRGLTSRYGIPVPRYEADGAPADPTWTFLRTGYGECLDSFFAFGLFDVGRRTEFFAAPLIAIFDEIMQEEARHILFLVNWAADLRARRALPLRPVFDVRRAWNVAAQAFDRVRGALAMKGSEEQDGFTMKTHVELSEFSLRSFLDLCLAENERRLAPYDERLLRPKLVPATVKVLRHLVPRGKSGNGNRESGIEPERT